MLDDKKIQLAAMEYSKNVLKEINKKLSIKQNSGEVYAQTTSNKCSFIAGVHWAIEQFLKDLWHPNAKEPEVGKRILIQLTKDDYVNGYGSIIWNGKISWRKFTSEIFKHHIDKWCYVDDLFSKQKGGE